MSIDAILEEKRLEKLNRQKAFIEKEKERLKQCKYDLVVIDFETTGIKTPLDAFMRGGKFDEILSVSIIDQNGNVLIDSLCKPEAKKSWKNAQEVHGITPAMVKDKPTFRELFPTIKEILLKSKLVMAYNIEFEMNFLFGYDYIFDFPNEIKLRENIVFAPDPMLMYCAYKGTEKWQKLSTVAKHFKFKFEAHNSLEDVKATLHCYKKLLDFVNSNDGKEYIIKYGYLYESERKGQWIDLNTYDIKEENLIKGLI